MNPFKEIIQGAAIFMGDHVTAPARKAIVEAVTGKPARIVRDEKETVLYRVGGTRDVYVSTGDKLVTAMEIAVASREGVYLEETVDRHVTWDIVVGEKSPAA